MASSVQSKGNKKGDATVQPVKAQLGEDSSIKYISVLVFPFITPLRPYYYGETQYTVLFNCNVTNPGRGNMMNYPNDGMEEGVELIALNDLHSSPCLNSL